MQLTKDRLAFLRLVGAMGIFRGALGTAGKLCMMVGYVEALFQKRNGELCTEARLQLLDRRDAKPVGVRLTAEGQRRLAACLDLTT